MDNLDIMQQAIDKAKDELSRACHFIDCGANAGIRKMNSNKADWLKWLIYLAEKGLAEEKILAEQLEEVKEEDEDGGYTACKECSVSTEAKKLIDAKDAIIEDITARFKSLQLSYDCEVEHRKAIIESAKLDYINDIIKLAHENCWLDGNVLVCAVDSLERSMFEMTKE